MKETKINCLAWIEVDNHVLLGKRTKDNSYGLPGGKLEYGEHPDETLKRECKEEMGVDIQINGVYKVYSSVLDDGTHWVSFLYRAMFNKRIKVNDEHEYFKWFHIDKLPEGQFHSTLQMISDDMPYIPPDL